MPATRRDQVRLVSINGVPLSLRAKHILKYYRVGSTDKKPYLTVRECIYSLFYWHNESLDIWSEILGAAYRFFLFFQAFKHPITRNKTTNLHFLIFRWSLAICKSASACFHLFHPVSENMNIFLCSLDFSSISYVLYSSIFMVHNFVRPAHVIPSFSFSIDKSAQMLLLVFLSVKVNRLLVECVRQKNNNMKETNGRRSAIFTAFVAFVCYPLFRQASTTKDPQKKAMMMKCLMNTIWSGLAAVTVYTSRFPECVFPGYVDRFLHSHTIWHLLISLFFTKADQMAKLLAKTCNPAITRDQTWVMLAIFWVCIAWDASEFLTELRMKKPPKIRRTNTLSSFMYERRVSFGKNVRNLL